MEKNSTGVGPIGYATNTPAILKAMQLMLCPTGIVVGVAVLFGGYSLGRKLIVDKQMRLSRQNRAHD